MSGKYSIKEIHTNTKEKFSCLVAFNDNEPELYEVDLEMIMRTLSSKSEDIGTLKKQLQKEREDLAKGEELVTKCKEAISKEEDADVKAN